MTSRENVKAVSLLFGSILAVAMLLPMLWLAIAAARPEADILGAPYSFPRRFTYENFRNMLHVPGFWTSLGNSVVVAVVVAILATTFGCLIGYLLSRYDFRGKSLVTATMFCGYVLSPVIIVLPYFRLLSSLGWMNTISGLVMAHFAFCMPLAVGVGTIIVKATPIVIEEVAAGYGCSLMGRLYGVVLPASRGNLIALFVLVFIISWKEFFWAFVLAPAQDSRTLPVLLAVASAGDSVNWGLVCALSSVLALPLIGLPLIWRISGKTGQTPVGGIRE